MDDENDDREHLRDELNRYFESGHLNSNLYDEDYDNDNDETIIEEENLLSYTDVQVKFFTYTI